MRKELREVKDIQLSLSKDRKHLLIHVPIEITKQYFRNPVVSLGVDLSRLTNRENQVFRLAADGKVAKEISTELNLSVRTVKFHLSSIYQKMNFRGKMDLILAARGQMEVADGTGRYQGPR